MFKDGTKYVVIEKFWRSFFVEVREEEREGKKVFVSPFQIKSPSTGLYREDYRKDSQDIKKAVKAAMKDQRYRGQKKKLIKEKVIKTKWTERFFALVGLTAAILLLVLGLLTLRSATHSVQSVSAKTEEALPPLPTVGLSFRLEQGLVGDAEGYQHGIIRQMMAQPEQFGFKGNRTDLQALIDWVGPEVHRIAIRAGYVDFRTGREIRVKYANKVSTVLNTDENGALVSISEYERNEDGSFKDMPTQVNILAPDCNSAVFQGDISDGVQSYEYPYQPRP